MIKPIPVGEVMDYSLPNDKENPTIWKLVALDSIVKTKVMAKMVTFEADSKDPTNIKILPKSGEASLQLDFEIVKLGLKGFSNFQLNGKEVPFETKQVELSGETYEVVSEKTLGYIPRDIIGQLAGKIFESSEVSEAEEKN